MAGYIGTKAVNLSTTGADINGNANVDGTLDVTGAVTASDMFITGPTPVLILTDNDVANEYTKIQNSGGATFITSRNGAANGAIILSGQGGGVSDEYARFISNGNFGIGTAVPATTLHVKKNDTTTGAILRIQGAGPVAATGRLGDIDFWGGRLSSDTGTTLGQIRVGNSSGFYWDGSANREDTYMSFSTAKDRVLAESMRITSAGDLSMSGGGNINTTNLGGSTNTIQEGPRLTGSANDNNGNRSGGVGVIRTAGTSGGVTSGVGVGIYVSSNTFSGYDQTYNNTLAYVFRQTSFHGTVDNKNDLGLLANRWDDVYATNGTIQTSDRNEKEAIASLTPAEMLVAARLSSSFKNFKWKDAVAEKGDDARLHSGIIAQDVQAAFTAEGLDASDYAMFISGTWWETQTDVPAVEAVAEVVDEDGVVVTEAVEAKDAYTRTDTYDTLEEAPVGATERTRLGVRYPELLAFVAAYSDQRFISIETRLAALEATP